MSPCWYYVGLVEGYCLVLFWPARFLRADGMKIIARVCVCVREGGELILFFCFFFSFLGRFEERIIIVEG